MLEKFREKILDKGAWAIIELSDEDNGFKKLSTHFGDSSIHDVHKLKDLYYLPSDQRIEVIDLIRGISCYVILKETPDGDAEIVRSYTPTPDLKFGLQHAKQIRDGLQPQHEEKLYVINLKDFYLKYSELERLQRTRTIHP